MTTHTKKAVGTIQYINYMESCVYAVGKCAFSSKGASVIAALPDRRNWRTGLSRK